jgi:hypothetical protein
VSLDRVGFPLGTPFATANVVGNTTTVSFGTGQASLVFGLSSTQPCNIELTWDFADGSGQPTPPNLILDYTLISGAHILMPLKLEFPQIDCSGTPPPDSCFFTGNGSGDHVFGCSG